MQTFQEMMTSALAEAGLSDEQVTSALTKIYANEKLSPKLNAMVKTATEDYQAQIGRVKQYQDWYPKAQAEYDRMASEYTKVQEELLALRAGGTGAQSPAFDASQYMTKADWVRANEDQARRFAAVMKETAVITNRHATRFKDDLDIAAIDELATKNNLPLTVAYEKWIEPRVKEQEKAANEQWKKDQRDEIERDLRSRYQLPTEQVPVEQSPINRKMKAEDAPKDMDAELLSAWRNAPAKA